MTDSSFHLIEATIDTIQAAFHSGEVTCRELTQLYLDRIDAYDNRGPTLKWLTPDDLM